ncbi:MAG: ABC transporter substrate-binding protein [Deltaproteobacteria bacterium]|nr:ABC transporter substrate-binding protein [Deltaproteobacteria bacterium]
MLSIKLFTTFLLCLELFSELNFLAWIPLTGSVSSWGDVLRKSMELAVEEINLIQGSREDRKIKIRFEDTQCLPNIAATVAKQSLAVQRPVVILGGLCSGDVLAQANIVNSEKIPFIVSGASSSEIRNAGEYVFRTVPTDLLTAEFSAHHLNDVGCKNLLLISEKTPYAQGLKNGLIKNLDQRVNVHFEDFNSSERNCAALITKARRNNSDCVVINSQTPQTNGLILRELQRQKAAENAKKFVFYSKGNQDLMEAARGSHVGVFNIELHVDLKDPKVTGFILNYKKKFGSEPTILFHAISAYDSVYLAHDAVLKSLATKTPLINVLSNNFSMTGIRGVYKLDADGELVASSVIFEVSKFVDNGVELVHVSSVHK